MDDVNIPVNARPTQSIAGRMEYYGEDPEVSDTRSDIAFAEN